MTRDYGPRREEHVTIKDITLSDEYVSITGTEGISFALPTSDEALALQVGDSIVLTCVQYSRIVGVRRAGGGVVMEKSDEDLEREDAEQHEKFERKKRDDLERNREAWAAREAALPDWIRARLEGFREAAGEKFELDGWGYELCIAELAPLYAAMGLDAIRDADGFSVQDSEEISAYAHEHGTSGNQHMVALALAKAHLAEPERSMAGTIAGLAPLTGSADYS